MKSWQQYARDAAVRVLDEGAERLGEGERAVHRLAKQWRELNAQDKAELVEIVVAIGGAVGMAAAAFREKGSKKKVAKKLAKKAGSKVLTKVAASNIAKSVVKAKKKVT